jgi:ribose-phosphate pyrophosphokinase
MGADRLVFAIRSYAELARQVCGHHGFEAGSVDTHEFPDGERSLRLLRSVERRNVVLVGGTVSDADTLELFDLACGLVHYGAQSLSLVIPYFGCSTMERAVRPGEVVTAKTRARLLSAVPMARAGNHVFLLDVHSEGLPHYFEGNLTPVHVPADPLLLRVVRRMLGPDLVLACADVGRAKRVQGLANRLGIDAGFVFKRRLDDAHTELVALAARVEGRRVLLYDDMIRTGSSLLNAARAYREAGASSVTAVATHGVFPGTALERLRGSGLLDAVFCTDSHPRAAELAGDFLRVEPVGWLLAEAVSASS